MKQVVSLGLVLALAGSLATACASAGSQYEPVQTVGAEAPNQSVGETTVTSALGGDGLPVQRPTESYDHYSGPLTGTLTLQSNGCWTADLGGEVRLAVFPPGYSKPATDAALMQAPDGMEVSTGMAFDGTGGITLVESLPGVPDGFWGNYISFCDPDARDLLILDSIEPAFRPDELSAEELAALLGEADLSVSWGCGLGFTVASADQRVALYVAQTGFDSAVTKPISLPDPHWTAEVAIGKNLMANHCDDVIEMWEPVPLVAARWPLAAGVLDFQPPPEDDECGGGDPVVASLRGAQVATPLGNVTLGDLNMVNDAYGCFAG